MVKLLDFGISKVMGSNNANLTAQGLMVGTPWYMSPEQARGGQLDHRSDLFSLAIVIYEAMAGQLPFDALGESEILFKIVSDPPSPIRELVPSLPPEVEQVFEKALAKKAVDRYQTVGDFVTAMRQALEAGDSRPLPKVIVSADVAIAAKRPKSRDAVIKPARQSKSRRATSSRKTLTADAAELPQPPVGPPRPSSESGRITGRRRTLTASIVQVPNEPLRPTEAPPDVRSVAPLFAARLIDDQAQERALAFQRQWGGTLIDALLRLELVGEADLLRAFAQAENTRYVRSDKVAKVVPQPALLQGVPQALAEKLHVLPLSFLPDLGELRVVAAVPIAANIPEELLPITHAQCVAIFVATPAAVHAGNCPLVCQ